MPKIAGPPMKATRASKQTVISFLLLFQELLCLICGLLHTLDTSVEGVNLKPDVAT